MRWEESAACLSSCSFILLTVEVMGAEEEEEEGVVQRPDVQALPWFGSSQPGDLSFCPPRHKHGFLIG